MSAFSRAEAAYLSPPSENFNPGEEDLLGERVFLPDEDAFATVEYGESWEDADEVGRYGGTTMQLKVHDQRSEIGMEIEDVAALVREQHKTDIHNFDPQTTCGHTFKQTYSACPHCGYRGR